MKISSIIVFGFLFASLAFFAPLNAQNSDSQIAELKQQIESLKSTMKKMEEDYYAVLLKNMKRQNELRAEIRKLKKELEKSANAQEEVKIADPIIEEKSKNVEKKAESIKREAFDKDTEYREAVALRLTREREEAEKKSTQKTEVVEKSKSEVEKPKSKVEKSEEKAESSFWDHAFPF